MSKTKERFSVSVDADVAHEVDTYVSQTENANRSAVVEQALRLWHHLAELGISEAALEEAIQLYQKQQERELYRSYYAELNGTAAREDTDWNRLSTQSAARQWPDKRK